MRQQLARNPPIALRDGRGQLDHLVRRHQGLVRDTVLFLQSLGVGLRHAEPVDDIARDVIAAEVHGREVADLPLVKDGDVGRAGAHLDQGDAELLLVVREDRERRRERLEHHLLDLVPGALDRLAQIHRRRRADRNEVHLRLEPRPDHSDRIAHPAVLVDRVFLRDRMEQLAVLGNHLRAGHLVRAIDIGAGDLAAIHGDDPLARHRLHVLAGDADIHRVDLGAGHSFGVGEGLADRARRFLDVADDAAAEPRRARLSDAEDLHHRVARQLANDFRDQRGGLRAPDVEPGNKVHGFGHCILAMTWSR